MKQPKKNVRLDPEVWLELYRRRDRINVIRHAANVHADEGTPRLRDFTLGQVIELLTQRGRLERSDCLEFIPKGRFSGRQRLELGDGNSETTSPGNAGR